VVGLAISAVWLMWRESNLQAQVRKKIVEGVRQGLRNVGQAQMARMRRAGREGFNGLKAKVGGSIDEEIAVIDASMQAILERKKDRVLGGQGTAAAGGGAPPGRRPRRGDAVGAVTRGAAELRVLNVGLQASNYPLDGGDLN
jgi:hypothetical protein